MDKLLNSVKNNNYRDIGIMAIVVYAAAVAVSLVAWLVKALFITSH